MDPVYSTREASGGSHSHVEESHHSRHSKNGASHDARACYRAFDSVTEGLLYFSIIFAPWAFGTTERWSTWVMNGAAFLLGALLMGKWAIRWKTDYTPHRWSLMDDPASHRGRWLVRSMAGVHVLLLLYCLVSAVNARSTFILSEHRQEFHDAFISWLPHSYDSTSSWFAFWQYLGLACFFWALRDWLLGKTGREKSHEPDPPAIQVSNIEWRHRQRIPDRMRRLLWVVFANAALLGLEGVLQRESGTNKLLWLVQPYLNVAADSQFGPWAYRSNAAQYYNLAWPLCLGFWWILRQGASRPRPGVRFGGSIEFLLLPFILIMAACPVLSLSRGGVIVTVLQAIGVAFIIYLASRHERWHSRLGLGLVLVLMLAGAGYWGWEKIKPRFEVVFTDQLGGREELYRNASRMLEDYPLYGSGPGTFTSLYQYYREDPSKVWEAMAHNDYLETRITFGWVGFIMALSALALVAPHWWVGDGIPMDWVLPSLIGVALAGCLIHARFDFPLQIYSVLGLFLLHCCLLCSLARQPARSL